MLHDIATGLLDLVYPRLCLLCREHRTDAGTTDPLCPECHLSLPVNRPPFCRKCSRPLTTSDEIFCDHCRQTDLAFDQVWAAAIYDENMRRLIHLFKYGGKTALRHTFAGLILDFTRRYRIPAGQFDGIMPAPLHNARLRERGYNQSCMLGEILAHELGLPLDDANLARTRNTRNQARLSPKERWTNVEGAFKITKPESVRGKRILIIDDLLTTGATLSGIAAVLKRAGAVNVSALTLAVTAHPKDD